MVHALCLMWPVGLCTLQPAECQVKVFRARGVTKSHQHIDFTDSVDAAVVRAENKFSYEQADLFACAAAYAFGIAKAHAFVDGNKRAAFVTSVTFLRLNGYQFATSPNDGLRFMDGIARGEVTELQFASWLQAGSHKL